MGDQKVCLSIEQGGEKEREKDIDKKGYQYVYKEEGGKGLLAWEIK